MNENIDIKNIMSKALQSNIDEVAPNFRRKNTLSDEQLEKIIQTISLHLDVSPEHVLIGMNLLFLQGAASSGAPLTMSINLGGGKCIEKRNIVDACNLVTGNKFIRRVAETLAIPIGDFAYKNKLTGELGYRINNKLKAETGESLNEKEIAFCSSFSQAIPNIAELTSERLAKLLAEDYQRRFEGRKKPKSEEHIVRNKKTNKKNKKGR